MPGERVIIEAVKRIAPKLVPKEGRMGDGTLKGGEIPHRQETAKEDVERAREIDKQEKASRTS